MFLLLLGPIGILVLGRAIRPTRAPGQLREPGVEVFLGPSLGISLACLPEGGVRVREG